MKIKKMLFSIVTLWSALIMSLTTGCASGGYKLTRSYAGFVNKQNIIIRIVLYILTAVVFAVTLLIDAVVFNTMDFWEGRVSQGTYKFESEDKVYVVAHSYQSGTELKKSHIEVYSAATKQKLQEITLQETKDLKIQVYVDGTLKEEVDHLQAVTKVSHLDLLPKKLKRS
jgi:hypothetical protein